MTGLALIHSPLVGPSTWAGVARELQRRGVHAVVPVLDNPTRPPFWEQHARSAAAALGSAADWVLVGHSGAGVLLPPIRQALGRPVRGYLFVDAGPPDGQPRANGAFADVLRELYARGERFPNWTDEALREAVPEAGLRAELLGELRPQPWDFWTEAVPVFRGWPDAPCAYLRFGTNPAYEAAWNEATRHGWPRRQLDGGHFLPMLDPPAVADALLVLLASWLNGMFASDRDRPPQR